MPARKMPANLTAVGRSQWMSLTIDSVEFILKYLHTNPGVVRFFKLTWAPDEMLFQTILYNSRFRGTMTHNNLRYIDWSEGKPSPKVLTMNDLEMIVASKALFARKFDMNLHPELLEQLDKRIAGTYNRQ